MKTRIHVNQHIIKRNAKELDTSKHDPPLTIKTYKENKRAFSVKIDGPSTLVYEPSNPLPCGARVWIETFSEVII
jgi:hypothetical protein